MSRAAAHLCVAMLVIAGATACETASPSSDSEPSRLEGLPQGSLVRIDLGVAMAPDNRTMTIRFIGGPALPPDDVCYTGYEGWARLVGQHLDLAVILVTDVHPPPGTDCAAAGFDRAVEVRLDSPFMGTTAQDLSDGHLLELERPPA